MKLRITHLRPDTIAAIQTQFPITIEALQRASDEESIRIAPLSPARIKVEAKGRGIDPREVLGRLMEDCLRGTTFIEFPLVKMSRGRRLYPILIEVVTPLILSDARDWIKRDRDETIPDSPFYVSQGKLGFDFDMFSNLTEEPQSHVPVEALSEVFQASEGDVVTALLSGSMMVFNAHGLMNYYREIVEDPSEIRDLIRLNYEDGSLYEVNKVWYLWS